MNDAGGELRRDHPTPIRPRRQGVGFVEIPLSTGTSEKNQKQRDFPFRLWYTKERREGDKPFASLPDERS